jgi:hypothetical protein
LQHENTTVRGGLEYVVHRNHRMGNQKMLACDILAPDTRVYLCLIQILTFSAVA